MLVLTRKPGERVLIGDDIVVTFLESRGDGIRIGIEAPRGVKIQRGEIVAAVTEANRESSQSSDDNTSTEDKLRAVLGLPPAGAEPAPAKHAEAPRADGASTEQP